MGISLFPPASTTSSVSVQPVGALGTYTLSTSLTPGLYKITTDTSQSLNSSQLYFETDAGFRFGAVVRGGQGYVSIPTTVTSITFSAGTFPLLIGFEKFDSYELISAPSSTQIDFLSPTSPYSVDITYTPPANAVSVGAYWSNGSFTDFGNTSGLRTLNLPTAPVYGEKYDALIVAKDENGVWGLGDLPQDIFPFAVFTSSGTYTPLTGSTQAKAWVVAGGAAGGGAGGGTAYRGAGGGGGGGVEIGTVSTNSSISVTVGAGGTATNSQVTGQQGGNSAFSNIYAAGGGGGGAAVGGAGSEGGSGGGGGAGGGAAGQANSTYGFPGRAGSGSNTSPAGGGGGAGGIAPVINSNNSPSGGGPALLLSELTNVNVSAGGGGGWSGNSSNSGGSGGTPGSPGSGGGGGALSFSTVRGAGSGRDGIVIIKALF